MEVHSQDLCFWSWVSVPSQLNPLNGNLLNGILPFLPMMPRPVLCPSQRYQWHFWSGNSPGYQRHAFGSSFFWPTELFEAAKTDRWWAQTKIGARKPPGVLLLVASGASKIMLIYQSLLTVVKLFIDSLKKKHPSTCNAVRNPQDPVLRNARFQPRGCSSANSEWPTSWKGSAASVPLH